MQQVRLWASVLRIADDGNLPPLPEVDESHRTQMLDAVLAEPL
jgi:hypothetical protein